MNRTIFASLILALISQAHAAPIPMAKTEDALGLPLQERITEIRAQGEGGTDNLIRMMFDKKQPMEVRWKATTAMGRIGGAKAHAQMEKALKSPEWFMRNAALVSMMANDEKTGIVWARRLLDDKALIVRAAAVDAIEKSHDTASLGLLWQKLNAKENFKRGQSLFIRRRIVETLSMMESAGSEAKFVALLDDKDTTLQAPAIMGLERITKQVLGKASEPMAIRKAAWQKWYKTSKTL